MQHEKVDTLQNGRQLTYGEYRDASRPLRRSLKQLGSGSLEAGLAFILQHEDAQASISQLIGVDKQVQFLLLSLLIAASAASVRPFHHIRSGKTVRES